MLPIICVGVLANLAFSWYATDNGKALDWSRFSVVYLVPAAFLSLLPWFWHAVRLAIWSRFFGVEISAIDLLRIAIATDVGAAIAPQAVGGAPVKMAMLVQQGYKPGTAASVTLLGNFEEVVVFCLIIPASLFMTRPWQNPLWQHIGHFLEKNGWLLLTGMLFLLALLHILKRMAVLDRVIQKTSRWWQHLASDFRQAVKLIWLKGRRPFIWSILVLSVQWITRFAVLLAVLRALGISDNFLHFFLLQWMIFVAMIFVPTPGAAGGAEAAFLLVFGRTIPMTLLGPALTGWRFLTYYFMLLVGVGLLWFLSHRAEH